MRLYPIYAVVIANLFAASSVAFAAGPFQEFEVGNWSAGAYTNDVSGKFSHCAAAASYKSGIFMLVSIDSAGGWSLAFHHKGWSLGSGERIPIELVFDNRKKFHVFGAATALGKQGQNNIVIVPMPVDSELIRRFRRSYVMQAFAKGQIFSFSLDATSRLLPALVQCVARNSTKVAKSSPSGRATGNVTVGPTLKTDGGATGNSAEIQLEAIQLATNFILMAGLQNPKILDQAATPTELASFNAAWKSDEAIGGVQIIRPEANAKGIEVAAAVAAADAKECKGKFASGRVSEMIDSEVVFRGFSSCEDTAGSRTAHFFVVPRSKGGFIVFSLVADLKGEATPKAIGEDRLPDFQKAALDASE